MKSSLSIVMIALIVLSVFWVFAVTVRSETYATPLDVAEKAAAYVIDQAISENGGYKWSYPQDGYTFYRSDIRAGAAGSGYFLLSLYEKTGNVTYLEYAKGAAQWIIGKAVPERGGYKWYTPTKHNPSPGWWLAQQHRGVSGIGEFLLDIYQATGNSTYLEYAKGAAQWLAAMAYYEYGGCFIPKNPPDPHGTQAAFGIQTGNEARTVLFLLHMYQETGNATYLTYVKGTAEWLISGIYVQAENGGYKWLNNYPYHSSGDWNIPYMDAQIAYFFYEAYQETHNETYLEYGNGALQWLISVAKEVGANACKWDNRLGDHLYRLIVEVSLLPTDFTTIADVFLQGYSITSNSTYLEYAQKFANWVVSQGVAENGGIRFPHYVRDDEGERYNAFVNSQIYRFLLEIYSKTENSTYLDYAEKSLQWIIYNATETNGGYKWSAVMSDGHKRTGWWFERGASGIGYYLVSAVPHPKEIPIAILSAIPGTADIGEDVAFNASSSYDPNGMVESYWIDYGDGSNSGWISSSESTHSYTESGIYWAKVKVKDDDGLESEWSEPLKITADYIELAKQYFPYLIFDEDEEYFPTDFYYDDENITNNPSRYTTLWPKTAYIHTVQGYWEEREYLVIEYWFYYVRDSKLWDHEIELFDFHIGAHNQDWESLYVFLEKTDIEYEPSMVAYFGHMRVVPTIPPYVEDFYHKYSWNSSLSPIFSPFNTINDTHPIVHIGLGSHASYPRAIPILDKGWPIYIFPWGDWLYSIPGAPDIPGLPCPEPIDGGDELSLNHFELQFVPNPNPTWPKEKFGEITAPWNRSRWNDPWYLLVQEPVLASMSVVAGSPVNLLITDPQGCKVGYDPETGTVVNDIPGASYSGSGVEPQIVWIPDPLDGNYDIQLIGMATGHYSLIGDLITLEGFNEWTLSNEIIQDEVDYYTAFISETGEMEVFSWEYFFEDTKRDTILKINTDNQYFQFITPDKMFSVKNDENMRFCRNMVIIRYGDEEMTMFTMANIQSDFCLAIAYDKMSHETYMLIDKPRIE